MVNLMLNDLRCPAGKGFDPGLQLHCLILHLDSLATLCLSGAAQKRQAAFFRFIFPGSLDDLGIEHQCWCAGIVKHDDLFADTDHICCHTDTIFPVGKERIQLILRRLQVVC